MAEEIQKKRTRRTQKFHRAIGNTSLADIMAKRNQKPEFRKAQREQTIKYVVTVSVSIINAYSSYLLNENVFSSCVVCL